MPSKDQKDKLLLKIRRRLTRLIHQAAVSNSHLALELAKYRWDIQWWNELPSELKKTPFSRAIGLCPAPPDAMVIIDLVLSEFKKLTPDKMQLVINVLDNELPSRPKSGQPRKALYNIDFEDLRLLHRIEGKRRDGLRVGQACSEVAHEDKRGSETDVNNTWRRYQRIRKSVRRLLPFVNGP